MTSRNDHDFKVISVFDKKKKVKRHYDFGFNYGLWGFIEISGYLLPESVSPKGY